MIPTMFDRVMHRNKMRLAGQSPVRWFYVGRDRPLGIEIADLGTRYRITVAMMSQPIVMVHLYQWEMKEFGVKLIDVVCRNWHNERMEMSHLNLGQNIEEFIQLFAEYEKDDF